MVFREIMSRGSTCKSGKEIFCRIEKPFEPILTKVMDSFPQKKAQNRTLQTAPPLPEGYGSILPSFGVTVSNLG